MLVSVPGGKRKRKPLFHNSFLKERPLFQCDHRDAGIPFPVGADPIGFDSGMVFQIRLYAGAKGAGPLSVDDWVRFSIGRVILLDSMNASMVDTTSTNMEM